MHTIANDVFDALVRMGAAASAEWHRSDGSVVSVPVVVAFLGREHYDAGPGRVRTNEAMLWVDVADIGAEIEANQRVDVLSTTWRVVRDQTDGVYRQHPGGTIVAVRVRR